MKQLILRTCKEDLTSSYDFQWKLGKNIAPDWDPKPKCGKGLHGLLWGEGHGWLLDYSSSYKWLVGEIDHFIDLDGKVKFPECNVIFIGDQEEATQFLYQNSKDKAICGLIMKGKNLKGGDFSKFTGGDGSDIVAGIESKVKVGDDSVVKVGYGCLVTAGKGCSIINGHNCNITVGDCSTIRVSGYSRINDNCVGSGTYLYQDGLIVPKSV